MAPLHAESAAYHVRRGVDMTSSKSKEQDYKTSRPSHSSARHRADQEDADIPVLVVPMCAVTPITPERKSKTPARHRADQEDADIPVLVVPMCAVTPITPERKSKTPARGFDDARVYNSRSAHHTRLTSPASNLALTVAPASVSYNTSLLQRHLLSRSVLSTSPFIARPLTTHQLLSKIRCQNCHKLPVSAAAHAQGHTSTLQPSFCWYHPGPQQWQRWSCCGQFSTGSRGCRSSSVHVYPQIPMQQLVDRYQFFQTPPYAPAAARKAIVIDCEMGTNIFHDTELIRVSVVDFESGDTLLDSLVCPSVPMLHYNTRFSGVTFGEMSNARNNGHCLYGTDSARTAVLKFVGPHTIVVGHSVCNDLNALRGIHPIIVDTNLLEQQKLKTRRDTWESEAGYLRVQGVSEEQIEAQRLACFPPTAKGAGPTSLKGAHLVRLGREMRPTGKHCSLEDARATRDLGAWHAAND